MYSFGLQKIFYELNFMSNFAFSHSAILETISRFSIEYVFEKNMKFLHKNENCRWSCLNCNYPAASIYPTGPAAIFILWIFHKLVLIHLDKKHKKHKICVFSRIASGPVHFFGCHISDFEPDSNGAASHRVLLRPLRCFQKCSYIIRTLQFLFNDFKCVYPML